jgi:uncharacterized protein YndB with AHSA1/START domain
VEAGTKKDGDRPPASTIGLRPSTFVVEREVHIDASPETVFEFFTDPVKAVRWMGVAATLDPRPGGIYRVEIGPYIALGEFVEVDPPNRIAWTWGWENHPEMTPPGSSTVEMTLTADGDGTVVRLVHSGLAPESIEGHAHGWDQYMPRLAIAATGGDPGPDPNAPKEES